MNTVIEFFNGKKTVIAALAGAILPWLIAAGKIDAPTAGMITGVLAALGISHKVVKGEIKKKA